MLRVAEVQFAAKGDEDVRHRLDGVDGRELVGDRGVRLRALDDDAKTAEAARDDADRLPIFMHSGRLAEEDGVRCDRSDAGEVLGAVFAAVLLVGGEDETQ